MSLKSLSLNLTLILVLLLSTKVQANGYFNQDNHSGKDSLQVSLLTYSPGKELHTFFGHSAIRISNRNSGEDLVYNYGTFDFDQPNFYPRFVQGTLLYKISSKPFERDMRYAKSSFTRVVETPLLISGTEKVALLNYLHTNLLPENQNYHYDFLYDNCATRIIKLIHHIVQDSLHLHPEVLPVKTFRQLLHEYTRLRPWTGLGIDFAMGIPADKLARYSEPAFLPNYLHLFIKNFTTNTQGHKQNIAGPDKLLWESRSSNESKGLFTPTLFFSILFVLFLLSGFIDSYFRKLFLKLGNLLILTAGILSLLLLYLWLGTEHYIFRWNTDLLWANPILIVLFVLYRKASPEAISKLFTSGIALVLIGAIASYFIQDSTATTTAALAIAAHLYASLRIKIQKPKETISA